MSINVSKLEDVVNEVKKAVIGKDEVTVDTKKTTTTKKSSTKVDDNKEPLVTLDSNKLILTQGAAAAKAPKEEDAWLPQSTEGSW